MTTTNASSAVCVLTARGLGAILQDGGSQAWVLDAKRAKDCQYVVCVQNRGFQDDWGSASADHHTAFVVGKLKDIAPSPEEGCEKRWILNFSHFAEINIPNAWPGHRNPVFYSDLETLGIDLNALEFQPMPDVEKPNPKVKALSIQEAKLGLAAMFSVSPEDIEIVIRA